ncbi:MAG: pilus assembly PilX N-terminal domain-containing protein [Candidatus Omnitrophota bacterium]
MIGYVVNNKKGMILISAYLVLTVLLVFAAMILSRSISEMRSAIVYADSMQAFYLAEAGIDKVKRELYDIFRTYFYGAGNRSSISFSWFDDFPNDSKYVLPTNYSLGDGVFTVTITSIDTSIDGQRDITIQSTAIVNNAARTITSIIRYGLESSKVFDYAYFVNNYGWFYGGGITANGDVRSNGDFAFQGNPNVNGDIYAAVNPDLGAAGTITGNNKNDTLSFYRSHADTAARPTNPTANPEDANGNGKLDAGEDVNGNGKLDDFSYPMGYDGTSERFPQQELLEMPYLGNLQTYKNLAVAQNGTIVQDGVTLVNNVLNGNVVLIGTNSNPIELNGPVVVTGDVVIKGKISGQGTIYAGRNTHIVGEIEYKNPPNWPKPDINPQDTDVTNNTRDFLGLITKGNVVIGDYTRNDWQVNVTKYLKPPFTQAYKVDATDADIGYVQYYQHGQPYFNGDYTVFDGGYKTDGSNRCYYESSYPDAYISSIAESSSSIRNIDAVTYTNHAFSGKVGAFTMNGTVISRDEAIIYSGNIDITYDVRAKSKGNDFNLPRDLATAKRLSWVTN